MHQHQQIELCDRLLCNIRRRSMHDLVAYRVPAALAVIAFDRVAARIVDVTQNAAASSGLSLLRHADQQYNGLPKMP